MGSNSYVLLLCLVIPREGVESFIPAAPLPSAAPRVIPREGVESSFIHAAMQCAKGVIPRVIPREGVERSEIVRNGVLDHPEMPHHGAKHRPFALSCREELLSPI